ncbi:MAG: FAD-dependent oxidoreductase [Methylocystaceae bacterium]
MQEKMPAASHPYWMASTPETNYPALEQDIKVDVAIIGGGMVGITTAYLLTKQGVKVAIIEADRILQGTTGHTTAKLTSQHDLIYASLQNQYGEELARQYAEANETAIRKVASIVQEHHIECDLKDENAYVYTLQDQYIKQIEDEVKVASKLGIKANYLDSIPLGFPIKAAMRFDDQAQYHPLKYLKPLAAWVTENGGQIFENTTVKNLESDEIVVTDQGHKIKADKIVIATHYPFFDGGALYFAKMYQEKSYVLGVMMQEKYPGGMYITAEDPGRSLRSQPYKDGELILVGGEHHRSGTGDDTEKHYTNLLSFANQHYTITDVLYRWSTQDCKTPDHIPYIGHLTARSPNLYVATGFRKWGMTNSTVAGMIISDLIVKGDNPWATVYNPLRATSLKGLGSIVQHNIHVAKDYISGKLSINPTKADIDAGDAKILEVDSKRMGIYKDEQGELHAVDITCTHLGCELKWNHAEKTWDCPCHGSRYTYEGEVVDGPTFTKLNHHPDDPNRVEARVFS